VSNIPSKSHDLAEENKKKLTEWKWLYVLVKDWVIFHEWQKFYVFSRVERSETSEDTKISITRQQLSLSRTPRDTRRRKIKKNWRNGNESKQPYLFSTWYSWKTAILVLNNNRSLTQLDLVWCKYNKQKQN
jgi:hypothetical protein